MTETLEDARGSRPDARLFAAGILRLGLVPIADAEWLEFGGDGEAQMAAKTALLAERRGAVLQHLPGSEDASEETLEVVRENLLAYHRGRDARGDGAHPLETAARLVQEDLCVLEPSESGYRLTAGCVCFPSNWSLAEKLGKPLRDIHTPVPGYGPALAAPVDRVFERLPPGRLVARLNWLIHDTDVLHQVGRPPDPRPVAAAEAGRRLRLRTERQVLRRLPRSGVVLFTIRTRIRPLAEAVATAGDAVALAAALRALPEPLAAYRHMGRFGEPLLAWLDARAAA